MILSPRRLIKIHLKNHKKAVECRNKYHRRTYRVNWFQILTIAIDLSTFCAFVPFKAPEGEHRMLVCANNSNLSTSIAGKQIESELETTAKIVRRCCCCRSVPRNENELEKIVE